MRLGVYSLVLAGTLLASSGGTARPATAADTCRGPALTPVQSAGVEALAGTEWRLVAARLGMPTPPDVSRVNVKFTDTTLSAATGCNTGGGAYKVAGGALVAPTFATTRKACIGPVEQWEPAFFRFLSSTPTIKRDGDDLVLTSAEGDMWFRSMPMPSANAVRKFVYVASERKPCAGMAPTSCLQIREKETAPWQLYYGEIIGFTHQPGVEYRLRILEDDAPDSPADGSSKRWFLDLVVEQRVVKR